MWYFRSHGSYQNLPSGLHMESIFPPEIPWTLSIAGVWREFQRPGTLCLDLSKCVSVSKSRQLCIHLAVSYLEAVVRPERLLHKGICLFTFSTLTQSLLVSPSPLLTGFLYVSTYWGLLRNDSFSFVHVHPNLSWECPLGEHGMLGSNNTFRCLLFMMSR